MQLLLPKPKHVYTIKDDHSHIEMTREAVLASSKARRSELPKYGERVEIGFVPRKVEDFGDGGAYPEIHVAQYPLGMGRKRKVGFTGVLAPTVDAETGLTLYDALVKQGGVSIQADVGAMTEKNATVLSQHKDALQRPSKEVEAETARKTADAFSKIVQEQVMASRPTQSATEKALGGASKPEFIRYAPQKSKDGGNYERLVRVVEAAEDPFEPARFKNLKKPAVNVEAPVPILHSPKQKIQAQDQLDWRIPPSVSNWGAPSGFAIDIDKRLASNPRNLQPTGVNDRFVQLTEGLYIAEEEARISVQERAKSKREAIDRQKQKENEDLRLAAEKARAARQGNTRPLHREEENYSDREARKDRDRLRQEISRDIERDMRLEAAGRQTRASREANRDVSERIALGMPVAKGSANEVAYDNRLFNQGESYNGEDQYSGISQPLFGERKTRATYVPTDSNDSEHNVEAELARLRNAEEQSSSGRKRNAPIEFERDISNSASDPFSQILDASAPAQKKKTFDHLDARAQSSMRYAAGSSAAAEGGDAFSRSSIRFTSGNG